MLSFFLQNANTKTESIAVFVYVWTNGFSVYVSCFNLQRLIVADDDEFEVFVTADGDTVWSGKETQAPEYCYLILEQMRADAEEQRGEEDEENADDEPPPLQDGDMFAPGAPDVRIPAPWTCSLFFCFSVLSF